MPYLCTSCVASDALREYIETRGRAIEACEICGGRDVRALEASDPHLKSRIRALVRFHFSEWHYNGHMGGDPLDNILLSSNPITNFRDTWNAEKYDDAIQDLIDPAYEPYEEGISLFSGYGEGGEQNPPLVALKNDESPTILALGRAAQERNYFLIERDVLAALTPRIADIEAMLPSATRLFRTRIGFSARATPLFGWGDERHYRPYSGKSLGAPPPVLASAGRMNRHGVAFLYLATDAQTAIAETRPHPGHFCSYGEFAALKDLRIADLSSIRITDFADSDRRLEDYLLLKTIDHLFSIPITPEGRVGYHFTQLLADGFRQLGFDAVRYKSSVGPGTNYVVFRPDDLSFIEGSTRVVKITGLAYGTENMQCMGDDDDYMTRPDGSLL